MELAVVREPTVTSSAETEQSSAIPRLNQARGFQGEREGAGAREGSRLASYRQGQEVVANHVSMAMEVRGRG